jgi:hypothetical protein
VQVRAAGPRDIIVSMSLMIEKCATSYVAAATKSVGGDDRPAISRAKIEQLNKR